MSETNTVQTGSGACVQTAREGAAARRLRFCVDGEWRESTSGKYMPLYNPSTGEVMAETPCCTTEEVDEAVLAASSAFPQWSGRPVGERAQLMFRYKTILDAHLDELAVLLATEMGKSLQEARGDVLKAIEVVELACALPVTMQGKSLMNVSGGHDTVSYREPLGVFRRHRAVQLPGHDPLRLDDPAGYHHRQHLRPEGRQHGAPDRHADAGTAPGSRVAQGRSKPGDVQPA